MNQVKYKPMAGGGSQQMAKENLWQYKFLLFIQQHLQVLE